MALLANLVPPSFASSTSRAVLVPVFRVILKIARIIKILFRHLNLNRPARYLRSCKVIKHWFVSTPNGMVPLSRVGLFLSEV